MIYHLITTLIICLLFFQLKRNYNALFTPFVDGKKKKAFWRYFNSILAFVTSWSHTKNDDESSCTQGCVLIICPIKDFFILWCCHGCKKRGKPPEQSVARDRTLQITVQIGDDLGETGSCFMEKIHAALPSAALEQLWTAIFTCCWINCKQTYWQPAAS